jgi:hypothetical protein
MVDLFVLLGMATSAAQRSTANPELHGHEEVTRALP